MSNEEPNTTESGNGERSYGHILRSTTIIGGAQGISYLIGMLKTKAVAILLGPAGVGLVGLYVSAVGFISTFTGLGITQSGVRDIAEADASSDEGEPARVTASLKWACLMTGIFGWLVTVVVARPMSEFVFGSQDHVLPISILGCTVFLSSISTGQAAILQGKRKITDLAKLGVVSVVAGTLCAVVFYGWLRERGIVAVLVSTAILNLAASWWYSRKHSGKPSSLTWREKYLRSRKFLGMGLAFMWSALLAAAVALITRSVIVKDLGLESGGVYQAAWGLSGMFAGFILSAMGTDFYPRLTSVSDDDGKVNRLVNEQSDIGILLALPGLIGTLAFAPWIMHLFFSHEFVSGAALLPWFVIGIFGRVVSFPIGYILLAKGCSRWFVVSETVSNLLLLGLTLLFLSRFGLVGSAHAFALFYGLHTLGMFLIARHLTGFRWTRETVRLLLVALAIVVAGVATQATTSGPIALILGISFTLLTSGYSVRGIVKRLNEEHRLVRFFRSNSFLRSVGGI